MNSEILLSFIVPVYNAENTLTRCLDSILKQPVKDFEIIIVNDASKDNSQSIIDKYVQEYPAIIKSFTKENGGPGDSRNYGIKKASGKYLTFTDSDDYLESNYYEVVHAIIDEHNPDMVIIGYNRIYNRKQNILERFYKFSNWDIYNKSISVTTNPDVICKIEGAAWLRIIRRELFFKNELLYFSKGRMAEDQEASMKWFVHAEKIIVCRERLYNYVINSNSGNFATHTIGDFMEVIDSVCSYYESHGKFRACYAELELLFIKQILISNMRRLRASKLENKYELFILLRAALLRHFPQFNRNSYLVGEPFYVRTAVNLSYYFPKIFKLIL